MKLEIDLRCAGGDHVAGLHHLSRWGLGHDLYTFGWPDLSPMGDGSRLHAVLHPGVADAPVLALVSCIRRGILQPSCSQVALLDF